MLKARQTQRQETKSLHPSLAVESAHLVPRCYAQAYPLTPFSYSGPKAKLRALMQHFLSLPDSITFLQIQQAKDDVWFPDLYVTLNAIPHHATMPAFSQLMQGPQTILHQARELPHWACLEEIRGASHCLANVCWPSALAPATWTWKLHGCISDSSCHDPQRHTTARAQGTVQL